ncbi:MAG: hypothetical protein ACOCX9_07735 [Spirochaetota bacterium]
MIGKRDNNGFDVSQGFFPASFIYPKTVHPHCDDDPHFRDETGVS